MKAITPAFYFSFLLFHNFTAVALEVNALSFNIRGAYDSGDRDWDARKADVISLVAAVSPDFMGVQEALPRQTTDMAQGLPEMVYFGRGRNEDGGGEGNQIFYDPERWALDSTDFGTFQISPTPEVPGSNGWNFRWIRICTWGRFMEKSTGSTVYVYNTHFPTESEGRTLSATLVAQRIADRAHPEDGVILTGDLNAGENETAMRILLGEEDSPVAMVDSYRELYPDETMAGTFSGWGWEPQGGNKIDYVLAMGHSETLDAEIIYQDPGVVISDHFPVRGKISFPGVVNAVTHGTAGQKFFFLFNKNLQQLVFHDPGQVRVVEIATVTGKIIQRFTDIKSKTLALGPINQGLYIIRALAKDGRDVSRHVRFAL